MSIQKLLLPGVAVLLICMSRVGAAEEPQKSHHDEMQAGHSHEMSEVHGGHVTMTPMNHFEVLFTPEEARVYLYDHEQKPLAIPTGVSVFMTLQTKAGESSKLKLLPVEPNLKEGRVQGYFTVEHDFGSLKEGSTKALIQVAGLAEKPIEFKTDVSLSEPAVYACPMHDSPPAMDPMKCPKCGMQMMRQSSEEDEGHEHSHHMDHDGNH